MYYLCTDKDVDEDGVKFGFKHSEFDNASAKANENNISVPLNEFLEQAECFPKDFRNNCESLDSSNKYWCSYDIELSISWIYDMHETEYYIFKGVPNGRNN